MPRLQLDPAQTVQEFADLSGRLVRGGELLRSVKDQDVQVATTPKQRCSASDKTTLYHYTPMAPKTVKVPVLVVYGLVGRYTMADLQEDRSLIRNLLAQGVDLYVVDWGNPTRGDRWLTIEDYVDGYLASASTSSARRTAWTRSRCSASAKAACSPCATRRCNPERVKNLILTITPIDFHADQAKDAPLHHGFINLWTRSMTAEDVDRLIEANGNLPGELMSFVFSIDDAARTRSPSTTSACST